MDKLKRSFQSLQCKVLSTLLLGVALGVASLLYVEITTSQREIREDIESTLRLTTSVIYSILEETMAKGRMEEVPLQLTHLISNPFITRVRLLDTNETPRFEAERPVKDIKMITEVRKPITPKEVCKRCHGPVPLIGYLEVGFDMSRAQKRLRDEMVRHIGLYGAMMVVVFSFIYLTLRRGIFSRLDILSRAMERFGRGELEQKIEVKGRDELSRISEVFNTMASNISLLNRNLIRVAEFSVGISLVESEIEAIGKTLEFLTDVFKNASVRLVVDGRIYETTGVKGIKRSSVLKRDLLVDRRVVGYLEINFSSTPAGYEEKITDLISSIVSTTLERIRHQEEVNRLNEQLLHLERLTTAGTMVGSLVHEINNPLSVINGAAEMIAEMEDSEKVKEYSQAIQDAAKRIERYINDMLVFVGNRKVQSDVLDLRDVVRTALRLKEFELKRKNIRVDLQLPEYPLPVKGVVHQLEQVLLNLINNAEYAMYKYRGEGDLVIEADRKDEQVMVAVKDNGPGISEDVLERIFDSFFTTKPPGEGTGLGLSIVRNIVEEHGGKIEVESEEGKGTVFTILLPSINGHN